MADGEAQSRAGPLLLPLKFDCLRDQDRARDGLGGRARRRRGLREERRAARANGEGLAAGVVQRANETASPTGGVLLPFRSFGSAMGQGKGSHKCSGGNGERSVWLV